MKKAAIQKELSKIAKRHKGLLKPRHVVDSAEPKDSPLHSLFEWDDQKASDEYRLWQARKIITICVMILPGREEPTQKYYNLKQDRYNNQRSKRYPKKSGGGYRQIDVILSQPSLRDQLLAEAMADFKVFKKKYYFLKELAKLFDAFDEL